LDEVNISGVPKQIKSVDDVNHVLAALSNALLEAGSMPAEEVHSLIKTLNSIKFTEQFGKQHGQLSKLTDEQVAIVAGWIREANKIGNNNGET
jgi:hypothetical protein